MTAGVAAVEAVAAVPATSTAAAIPAVEAVAAIPATGDELEAERVAEALSVAEKAKAVPPVTPVDAIIGDATVKPEGVPDKFWDAAKGEVNYVEWNKAHSALETQFHADKDKGKTPEVIAAEKVISDAKEAGAPAGSEAVVASARAEYAEKGELSSDTYSALAGAGLDKATVDGYLAGVEKQSGELQGAAHTAAEGEDNYTKMLEWAAEGLDDGAQKTYNTLIASGDVEVVKGAVTDLYAKYKENVTVEAERIGGVGSSSSNTFASKAEMTAAMNAPAPNVPGKSRYETDPAYRVECQAKIKASRKAGISIFE